MSTVEIQHIKSDGHQVILGRRCLGELAELLSTNAFSGAKLFILVDENTVKFCLPSLISKVSILGDAEVLEIGVGEDSKSVDISAQLWSVLSELNADRGSVIINLGGGVITDLGGFVAGTFKRGIRFFNIPTTLLAQVDASVGGKVGINHDGLKNEIGLFNNPDAVFIDPDFLGTLPRRHLLSGFSEMIKHGLICDKSYWEKLKEVSFFELAVRNLPDLVIDAACLGLFAMTQTVGDLALMATLPEEIQLGLIAHLVDFFNAIAPQDTLHIFWINLIENAFDFFGGTPFERTDNLPAAFASL